MTLRPSASRSTLWLNSQMHFSGEKYVSVSFVKPVLHLFNTSILAVEEEDTDLTR
uniref:Uncharacterized protein n=1 Tax=Anguilla anguilla TaxID=7936 RepID=A0A0E9U350_ANGAN